MKSERGGDEPSKERNFLPGRLGLETARIPQHDRHGLLWLGRGQLYVDSGTLRFKCAGFDDLEPGDYAIPFQLLTGLMLQPGTSLTHDVLRLCHAHGTGIFAVAEGGTRCFASAPAGPRQSRRARQHARIWADEERRVDAARRLYAWRLGEVFPHANIAVLRGMEGSRMKETYKLLASKYGVDWKGRKYDRKNPDATDLPNQAINHAVTAVEATARVAVAVAGAVPQLGFIHEDAGQAFSLDITDLFRDKLTLPIAFAAIHDVEKTGYDIERATRKRAAKELRKGKIVSAMIDKIKELLDAPAAEGE